jgi:REP element-mobilizing transposase RayT
VSEYIHKSHNVTVLLYHLVFPAKYRRAVFRLCSHVKKQLWGGEFWTDGYFVSTVGRHGDEDTIRDYVKKQGDVYQQLYEDRQLALF